MLDDTSEIYNGLAVQSVVAGEVLDYAEIYEEPGYRRINRLAIVESFVQCIQSEQDIAFDVQPLGTHHVARKTTLAKFYQGINRVLQNDYPDDLQYSPRVEVFLDACQNLNITPGRFQFGRTLDIEPRSKWRYADIFNELILEIRHRCSQSKFKIRLKRHERNVRRRRAKAFMWLRALYGDKGKSRYLFLVLNLGYRKELRKGVTPEIIQADLHRFLSNRRNNALLRGIQAYIAKIEEGDKGGGLHAHILIAYTAERRDDINLTKALGTYWVKTVTRGRGKYWNSNRYKLRNEQLGHGDGTGTIDHDNIPKREALLKNIAYLCKAGQYLKYKTAKFKTLWLSKPPERCINAMGRPRKAVDESALLELEQYIIQHGWDEKNLHPHDDLDAVAI